MKKIEHIFAVSNSTPLHIHVSTMKKMNTLFEMNRIQNVPNLRHYFYVNDFQNNTYIARMNIVDSVEKRKSFALETILAKHAEQHDFGPAIHSHHIFQNEETDEMVSMLVMQRFDGTLFANKHLLDVYDIAKIMQVMNTMHDHGIWHADLHQNQMVFQNTSRGREWKIISFKNAWPLGKKVPNVLRACDRIQWAVGEVGTQSELPDYLGREVAIIAAATRLPEPMPNYGQKFWEEDEDDLQWSAFQKERLQAIQMWFHDSDLPGERSRRTTQAYLLAIQSMNPRYIDVKHIDIEVFLERTPYILFDTSATTAELQELLIEALVRLLEE
jgi:hypothetical protein